MKKLFINPMLSAKDIMRIYGLSQSKAYLARKRGYIIEGAAGKHGYGKPATRTIRGLQLSSVDALEIARQTARRFAYKALPVATSHGVISDLQDEIAQAVLIELWVSGISDKALAYKAGRRRAIDVCRKWYKANQIPLDDWLIDYESDGLGDLDMSEGEEQ